MTKRSIFLRTGIRLLAPLLLMSVVLSKRSVSFASAETGSEVQRRYELTDALADLQGSTIGGEEFDVANYPHSSNGKPQIISLVEFCYSYYTEQQSDYALYVYMYNPQDYAFDTTTARNKIQFTYGEKADYSKYYLEFINYSKAAGYEGRFYKFKIVLTDNQCTRVLNEIQPNSRVYKISGFELSVKNAVTEYTCAQVYTYSGFAEGYGSELATSDTLSCTVDGLDMFLSLDVRSTYYRPQGTHEDGYTRDTLHSVYFSVPNEIIEEYGKITAVHATWMNAYTAPMLITGNKTIYDTLLPYIGQYVDGSTISDYANTEFPYAIIATKAVEGFRDNNEYAPLSGYYAYNAYHDFGTSPTYDNYINYLHYLFYAGSGTDSADKFTLSAEAIIGNRQNGVDGWLETYTQEFGGKLINDRYSAALFEAVDEQFTDKTITGDEEYELTDITLSSNPWRIWLGKDITQVESENYSTASAIQKVTVNDFNSYSSKSSFCEKFFVDESDYSKFQSYVKTAAGKNETVYLFRYHLSEYVSNEATEYERTSTYYIFQGNYGTYSTIDTNAYFAQMWIQLDFDIIDLTFTKNNVDTVIPVIMSPMDLAADAEPPASVQTDKKTSWWNILLGILALILLFILIIKFAPWIVYGLVKLIALPFKVLAKLCKAGRERRRERRAERKERREEKRKERKARKESERQRRKKERFDTEWEERLLDEIDWDSIDWEEFDGMDW